MLKPTLIRFHHWQTKWLKKRAAGGGGDGTVALEVRRLVNNAMIDDGALDGFCEGCRKPLSPSDKYLSDSEGILVCRKCAPDFDAIADEPEKP